MEHPSKVRLHEVRSTLTVVVSDIVAFVLKRDVKLQPTNQPLTVG